MALRPTTRFRIRPGAPPGTLVADEGAAPTTIRVLTYDRESCDEREVVDPEELATLRDPSRVTWIDACGLGGVETIRRIGEIFDLHGLALEDVLNTGQRAKVEAFGDVAFVVLHMMHARGRLEAEQVSLFLGPDFVITVQERPGDCLDPVRARIREGRPRLRSNGADYLAYALLDAVVDHYFPLLERYAERLEVLENRVLERPDHSVMEEIFAVKRDLLTLRRAVWPLREALRTLVREELPHVTDGTRVFLRDCLDHSAQLLDAIEAGRELTASLTDVYLSSVSNRMNEVMKVLTIFAALFIPLTLVAGIYGMNFDPESSPWNMPELGWIYGYPFALGLMLAIAVSMLVYFRRKKWF